jgi:hypothetical protein
MPGEAYVLIQFFRSLPRYEFQRIVDKYHGDFRTKRFNFWDQLVCMKFAHIRQGNSLRDIDIALNAHARKLYHIGIQRCPKGTLADANEHRDYRIYEAFAKPLMQQACREYAEPRLAMDVDNAVYALDASVVDLPLSIFPWTKFRKTKAAIKLHAMIDLRGNIPAFRTITDGKRCTMSRQHRRCPLRPKASMRSIATTSISPSCGRFSRPAPCSPSTQMPMRTRLKTRRQRYSLAGRAWHGYERGTGVDCGSRYRCRVSRNGTYDLADGIPFVTPGMYGCLPLSRPPTLGSAAVRPWPRSFLPAPVSNIQGCPEAGLIHYPTPQPLCTTSDGDIPRYSPTIRRFLESSTI